MNPSKENAQKALDYLNKHLDNMMLSVDGEQEFQFIKEFLERARAKLPSEATFNKKRQPKGISPAKEDSGGRPGFVAEA